MEIVGVVAAVPALLKMIQVANSSLGPIASKTRTNKLAQGIRTQLNLLAEILSSIETRGAADATRTCGQDKRLAPLLRDVETDVKELLDLLERTEGPKGGSSPNIFRRAKLVLSGLEKDVKDRGERLGRMVNTLQVYLAEWTIRSDQQAQLRKILATASTTFIPKKLEGTLQWIWTHETFEKWATPTASSETTAIAHVRGPSERVLIIHGVKGSGKSVLAASVVEGLREKKATTLFFSFWASHGRERRIEAMLRALLLQLLESLPEDTQFKFIPRLLEKMKDLKDPRLLVDQLCAVAQEYATDVFCVLDGIDESVDDWNSIDNESPLAHLGQLISTIPKLRLLLVGRQSSLRSAIKRWPIQIELTRELVLDDLRCFIASELDNCPTVTSDYTREMIRKELDAKAAVMFLWIKLMFRGLRSSFSPNEIRFTLGRIPEELDREYSRLLSMLMTRLHGRSKDPSAGMIRARGLLEILVGASRPLSFVELRLTYAFSFTSDDSDSGYLDNLLNEEGIIDGCGDFITVRDGLISLGHTSMREFLLRPADRWTTQDGNISFFRLDAAKAHTKLAIICLRYLRHVDWEQGGNDNTSDWASNLAGRYPMLYYASTYGTSHLLDSDLSPEMATAAGREFLSSGKFTAWMDFATSESTPNSPLCATPLYFWEDVTHFWAACAAHGTFESPSQQLLLSTPLVISTSSPTVPSSAPATVSSSTEIQSRGGSAVPAGDVHKLRSTLNLSQHIKHRDLAKRFFEVVQQRPQQLAKMSNFLMSPSDLLFQALERYMNSASFLCLMFLGATFEFASDDSKPQALRLYTKGLSRVEGQGGLREALALGRVADCGSNNETSAEQYKKIMEILEPDRCYTLINIAWASTAHALMHRLISLGRSDEATLVVRQAEDAILKHESNNAPQAYGTGLRHWCHRQWCKSNLITKKRNVMLIDLAYVYFDLRGYYEDANRILSCLAQDIPALKSVPSADALQCMVTASRSKINLANSDMAYRSEMLDEARFILQAAGQFARDSDFDFEPFWIEISLARDDLIIELHRARRYQEAEEEVDRNMHSLFQKIADYDVYRYQYVLEYVTLSFLEVYFTLDRRDEAVRRVLELHSRISDVAFLEGKPSRHETLTRILRSLISYSMFTAMEKYLRQLLSHEDHDGLTGLNHLFLLEALAFSVRHQAGREEEAIAVYSDCFTLASSLLPEYSRRLQIGLGMSLLCADNPAKAAIAFEAYSEPSSTDLRNFGQVFATMISAVAMWKRGSIPEALCKLNELQVLMEGAFSPLPTSSDQSDKKQTRAEVEAEPNGKIEQLPSDEPNHPTLDSRYNILKIMTFIMSARLLSITNRPSESHLARQKARKTIEAWLDKALAAYHWDTTSLAYLVKSWALRCLDYTLEMDCGDNRVDGKGFPWFPLDLLARIDSEDEAYDVLFWPSHGW